MRKNTLPKKIRVRIAPSPTGPLHLGTARTALFNYLFAKKHKGTFILRIEDTDRQRSKKEFERDIIDSLLWLGLEWDEGPSAKKSSSSFIGNYGPYRQSERGEIYKKYLKKLLDRKKIFYCFHSPKELAQEKEQCQKRNKPFVHRCSHKHLSSREIKNYLIKKKSYVLRFRGTRERIVFEDLVRGEVSFQGALIGDFSLAKGLEEPLYNFAAAVDDAEMKISHVIRGEDHISNTPKQILLQQALGFPHPQYAHLPLILGPDRTKLSKRHGAVSLRSYRKKGYLPEALLNFMAFLGWNPGTQQEIFSLEELIDFFSLSRVQKGGAIFNLEKLEWLNGYYLRNISLERLLKLSLPYLKKIPLQSQEKVFLKDRAYLKKVLTLVRTRVRTLSELSDKAEFFFRKKLEYSPALLRWKAMTKKELCQSLEHSLKILELFDEKDFKEAILKEALLKEAQKLYPNDRGWLLWPLRAALTGKKASPSPFEVAAVLGKERSVGRIKKALKMIERDKD